MSYYICVCMHTLMWKSEDNVKELVLTRELKSPGLVASALPTLLSGWLMFILESWVHKGLLVGSLLTFTLTSRNFPMPAYTHRKTPEALALSFST